MGKVPLELWFEAFEACVFKPPFDSPRESKSSPKEDWREGTIMRKSAIQIHEARFWAWAI